MASWQELAQGVLTHGIDAFAETQVARYQANDPTPNNRGNGSTTSRAGQPAFETITDVLTNPTNLVLLGVAAVLVFVLIKGRS
jgi:hypothetical protein